MKKDQWFSGYRPEIDGIRCIAVLAVVLYHFDFFFGAEFNPFVGGYIGVDIFFVVSGYVITQSIISSIDNNNFSLRLFYIKRIKRLFPAAIVTFILCYLFGYFFLYDSEFEFLAKNALYSMVFFQNINLTDDSGYFSQEAEVNLFLHFWSLSVEEQFYILFPVVLLLFYKTCNYRRLIVVIFFMMIAGFFYSNWLSNKSPNDNFFLLQSRAFQLLAGSFVFLLRNRYEDKISRTKISSFLAALGLALMFSHILYGVENTSGPNVDNILPVIGAGLSLFALSHKGLIGKILCWKPISLMGLVSYEIYLLHFPLVSGLTIYFGGSENVTITTKFIALLACLVTSFLVHFYITNKIRYDSRSLRAALSCSAAYFLTAILFTTTFMLDGFFPGSFSEKNKEIGDLMEGPLWQYHNNNNCLERYGFEGYNGYGWFFCYLEENKDPEVVILGNSFANHWYPMINNASKLKDLNVLSYGNNSLPHYYQDLEIKSGDSDKQKVVKKTGEIIREQILTNENVKYVVISLTSEINDEHINALRDIRSQGDFKIILISHHAKPEWKEVDTASCFSRPFGKTPDKCRMAISDLDQVLSDDEIRQYMDFAISLGKTYVFNPNVGYCNAEYCDFTAGELPVFRDVYHHLSLHGNYLVQPFFNEFLESIE